MPKVLWRDGKFVPNPLLEKQQQDGDASGAKEPGKEKGQKESALNSKIVMKECNALMTVFTLFAIYHKSRKPKSYIKSEKSTQSINTYI